jgi:gluconolactonase
VFEDSVVTRLWTGGVWTEGPVQLAGGDVLFSDIPNDRVLRWSPDGTTRIELQPAGYANGHTLDREGRVIQCEHGNRRVSRIEPDGTITGLVDRYAGKRLNSPNDVVVRSDGTIWFTDPPYGILSDREGHKAESELGAHYVFRFDPATEELTIVSDHVVDPNGLAFSPDETLLYVSDTSAARLDEQGNHHIVVFDVVEHARLADPRVFAVVDPGLSDGFRLDPQGRLYTSSAMGLIVYAPDGAELGRIPIPEVVSNCVFDATGARLYVTASSSLYAVDLTPDPAASPRSP